MMEAVDAFHRIVQRTLNFLEYSRNPREDCPFFPDHVHIEPTNACNLRCVHCHQSSRGTHFTKKIGMMDFNVFQKVIDEIRGIASRITLNQQGEPLLHPRILDMVAYAKGAGLSVSVLTNATRLSENVADELLNLGLNRIVFSFEGSNQQVHESIRRGSNYHKTLRNILYFIKRNQEIGHPTFVCMSMVHSSHSASDIDHYHKYFSKLPVDTIFVNPLLSMSGAAPTSGEIDLSVYSNIPKENLPVCRLPWESIVVNWDGTVSPCAVDYNESHVVGSVLEADLTEIFNGPLMRRFRRCHLDRDYTWIEEQGPLCASCNCRFQPEYDLRDLSAYTVTYIVRQATVFAPQYVSTFETRGMNTAGKLDFAESELRRIDELLKRSHQ